MKMMKDNNKVIVYILAFSISLLLLTGCGDKADKADKADKQISDIGFSYSDGIDENGYYTDVRALDFVELFDYQALAIPSEVHHVSNDDVQSEIDYFLEEYPSRQQITDRAVADGDTVNIDYVGSVAGVEFERGSTEGLGVDVTIGVTNYIDDFLEQLIGSKPGETVNVEVTFPEDYHEPTLQGKDALFVTVINYIVVEEAAELTDEFVALNLSAAYGWSTVEEMEEGIRQGILGAILQQYVQYYLVTEVSVKSVPDRLIEYQQKAMLKYYREYAEDYMGVTLEEYLYYYGGFSNAVEFLEVNREENIRSATFYLVVQAVAEDAGISVGDEDMIEYFGENDLSVYEEYYGLPYLKQAVICEKVLNIIVENVVLL